ncbi:transglutaminase-like domain-containing protein [Alloalcanivorax gelatiniphagus]
MALMAVILSIFDDTFADRTYLVAGLAPVVVLLALALVTSRVHEGGWWYTLAALVLFSPLGALAALREPGPYLVPTLDTMSGLLADSVDAPLTLVGTVPPVDPTGEVMLIPFLIGFLATLPAAWLALGTRRPMAPAVPVALGLGATIPLGVLVPTLLVPRGIVVAILLVAWGAVRAGRRDDVTRVARGSVAATTTAVLTVALVSGLVALLVPDTDQSDRVLLRGDDVPLSGAADTVPLPDPQGSDALLRATGVPEGQRLRFVALDLYDGQGWIPADQSPGSEGYGTFKRIGHEVAPLHPGRTVVVRVRMRPGYTGDWLPMLGELTSIDLDWNPGRTSVADLRYNQATASAFVLGGVDTRDAYEFESVVPTDSFTRRDETREPSDDQRQPAGAFLDEHLRPFARDELLPLERVLLLARYLRVNGTLRPVISGAQSPDDLGRRMLGARRISGNQYQYSALMALGAARLGVAARVVTGVNVGRRGVVDTGDVTSWVELQFADGTWRPLDPERYVGERVVLDGDTVAPPAPGDFVADELADAAKGRDDEIRPPDGSTNPDGSQADEPRPAWQVLLGVGAAVVALAALALLLVPLVKLVRRGRRRRTSSWSATYVNGWQEVLDVARDRGTSVPDSWSRVAQASALGVGTDLARRADAAVFAPGRTDDDAADFWRACQALRRELLAATRRRQRWWSYVNPASLVAGWARRRSAGTSAGPVTGPATGPAPGPATGPATGGVA